MVNFLIYTGVLLGLIFIFIIGMQTPHYDGAYCYPSGL